MKDRVLCLNSIVVVQVVQRSLQLSERMVALAAAVSVAYDYFSQHSHGSGWFAPMMLPPVPYPSGGGAEGGAAGDEEGGQASDPVPGDAGKHAVFFASVCRLSGHSWCSLHTEAEGPTGRVAAGDGKDMLKAAVLVSVLWLCCCWCH